MSLMSDQRDEAAARIAHQVSLRPEDKAGWDVIEEAVELASRSLRASLQAGYALGSLAHGGFVDAVSDVDLALIVASEEDSFAPDMLERIAALGPAVRARLATPAAGRLSVFWSSWADLAAQTGRGRFPLVDQVDFVRSALPLFGDDRRSTVILPAGERLRDELVLEGARFAVDKLAQPAKDALLREPARLIAAGRREISKAVLFPVRFIYTVDTGGVASNSLAVEHYCEVRCGAASTLVCAALRWREAGIESSGAALALLTAELPSLYQELAQTHQAPLRRAGHAELADALLRWGESLAQNPPSSPAS